MQGAVSTRAGIFVFCTLSVRGKRAKLKRLFIFAFYRKIRQIVNISHMIKHVSNKLLHFVRRKF